MAREKAEQAERVAWEHAAQDMRVALIGFAKEKRFVKALAIGLGLFWQDRYTADTVHMMSVDESLRFFDWFAYDYALYVEAEEGAGSSSISGKRLIEVYRDEVADALTEKEAATLEGWIESLPGSAFVLEGTDVERGSVVIRDLFLPERTLVVRDTAAAKHGLVGQILLARPLPEREGLRLGGATAVLPAIEEGGLCAFLEDARQAYLDAHPESTMAQFLRDRAYLLTHYALEWAEREGRPATAAQDPDAVKPGAKSLQKLIKWSQDRVQVR
jgi:hypothetical protein